MLTVKPLIHVRWIGKSMESYSVVFFQTFLRRTTIDAALFSRHCWLNLITIIKRIFFRVSKAPDAITSAQYKSNDVSSELEAFGVEKQEEKEAIFANFPFNCWKSTSEDRIPVFSGNILVKPVDKLW